VTQRDDTSTRRHVDTSTGRLGLVAAIAVCVVATSWASALAGMSRARRAEVFYQAQGAYERGAQLTATDPNGAERLLREAANGFQALVDDGGVNGRLYYNLGNTYLRLNQVGSAILYYRKAARRIPDDGRLAEGLRVARSVRRNDIPVTGQTALIRALLLWHYRTTLRGRAAVGIVAYVGFWLIAISATF